MVDGVATILGTDGDDTITLKGTPYLGIDFPKLHIRGGDGFDILRLYQANIPSTTISGIEQTELLATSKQGGYVFSYDQIAELGVITIDSSLGSFPVRLRVQPEWNPGAKDPDLILRADLKDG